MNGFRIQGGSRLSGSVRVGGSKNAALAIAAGALVVEDEVILHNYPDITDARVMIDLLRHVGVQVEMKGATVHLDASHITESTLPEDLVRRMRGSFNAMGPILARLGQVKTPLPGGCKIGNRPVGYHIKGFRALGATVDQTQDSYEARADRLVGGEIYFDTQSAGATQHMMTTACLADGITVIQNAAMEPEVVDLAYFLNRMGAVIEGAGTATITIQGVSKLKGGEYTISADRIQAGTYMLAGAITGGDVRVEGVMPESLHPLTSKLRESGITVTESHDMVRVQSDGIYNAVDIKTNPYPGFPTDLQQPMCSFLTLASGTSVVEETIYGGRTNHVNELQRMGAEVRVTDTERTVLITGVKKLTGAQVESHDLRGGAAMVLAALAAEGESLITGIEYIDRGYERFEDSLNGLGASVERVEETEELPVVSTGT